MKLYQVDAFTAEIFQGNPAGVCILPAAKMRDELWLQNIAAEMNLSETAFLHKRGREYQLRWFTPTREVSLCGHATLSAAHILWETGRESPASTLLFNTLSGQLPVRRRGDWIELDFPRHEVKAIEDLPGLNAALGIEPLLSSSDGKAYLLEVKNLAVLKAIQPDFGRLKAFGNTTFTLTCRSDDPHYDFCSRFFAPALGIDEDPVTGSAHTRLAPYWARKLGKKKLRAFQASLRGGNLECELSGKDRVLIRGRAVTVFKIEFTPL
jgi:PhzF family phenazine biosynthesis protein